MQGLRHVVRGQVPDLLVRPLLFIALFGGAVVFFQQQTSALWAMSARLIVSVFVLFYESFMLRSVLPIGVKTSVTEYKVREWIKSALPLFGLSVLNVIHARADVLMLGAIRGVEEVALYTVALMLSSFVSMILTSANTSLAPVFARLHAENDSVGLKRIVVRSARGIMIGSFPIIIGLIFGGRLLLSLFGPKFSAAYPVLAILIIGQIVNIAVGSVGILLTMTGREHATFSGRSISALLYVGLNAILIPKWGIVGAAIATTVSTIAWNSLLVRFAWRELGILSFAFARSG